MGLVAGGNRPSPLKDFIALHAFSFVPFCARYLANEAEALGMTKPKIEDPFRSARERTGVLNVDLDGETIPLLLRYRDVRTAAKNWQTFSSNAPCRVPIPSEEKVRSVRQLPIETDPPEHKRYRALVEPHFRRPLQPEYLQSLHALIDQEVEDALKKGEFDVVHDFALPLQSKALTLLLGVPIGEADTWVTWGTSVFNEGDGVAKGNQLEAYIQAQLDKAEPSPSGNDFFSALTQMTIDGRPLERDEMVGIANLTFAGGRDTVINAVTVMVDYFADHSAQFLEIASDERRVNLAVEEFVRIITPLTFIGRVCPNGADIGDQSVAPDERIGLCWASANFDDSVFEDPEQIKLSRSPNPHVGFGSGHHACLGAPQARAIMRRLLETLAMRVAAVEVIARVPRYETHPQFKRWMAYERLNVRFIAKSN